MRRGRIRGAVSGGRRGREREGRKEWKKLTFRVALQELRHQPRHKSQSRTYRTRQVDQPRALLDPPILHRVDQLVDISIVSKHEGRSVGQSDDVPHRDAVGRDRDVGGVEHELRG